MWSVPGIEYSGGSEGIGLSVSVGLALANRLDGNANHIFTLIGDGESNEGQVWESGNVGVQIWIGQFDCNTGSK